MRIPITKPRYPMHAATPLYIRACLTDIPDLTSIAKSPSSCGSSWQNTASDVLIPPTKLAVNAAPVNRMYRIIAVTTLKFLFVSAHNSTFSLFL